METRDNATVREAEEEAARLMGLLARLVRLSSKSMRALEIELGLGSSVVSKILAGDIRPQMSYLLMIAKAIGVSPEDFFSLAYRPRKRPANPLLNDLLEVDIPPEVEEPELRVTRAEMDQMVEAAVRRALQRIGGGGEAEAPDRPATGARRVEK